MDELPEVLLAYKETSRRPTGVSTFGLSYGMEAIIPTEIRMPTLRTEVPRTANVEAISNT